METEIETKRRPGRPPTGRTAADRKRKQRAARDRATAENIRRVTVEVFELAVVDYCNDRSQRPLTVMQLIDKIAERFPEEERRRVYRYYLPATNESDDPWADDLCFAYPDRRRSRRE